LAQAVWAQADSKLAASLSFFAEASEEEELHYSCRGAATGNPRPAFLLQAAPR